MKICTDENSPNIFLLLLTYCPQRKLKENLLRSKTDTVKSQDLMHQGR